MKLCSLFKLKIWTSNVNYSLRLQVIKIFNDNNFETLYEKRCDAFLLNILQENSI